VLSIQPLENPEMVRWALPPSKSHMIRWIALSSQSESKTELVFRGVPGRDIESMAACMEEMGASIEKEQGKWTINGPRGGLLLPNGVLDCGNSATTARFVTSIAACLDGSTEIDGDFSLRNRDLSSLTSALRELGCDVSSDRLPYTVHGPIIPGRVDIDESFSSQTLSGIILASPKFSGEVVISLRGEAVSRWYRDLTIETSSLSGWTGKYGETLFLDSWVVETPERVVIPSEVSLFPISLLFDNLHGTKSLVNCQFGESPITDAIEEFETIVSNQISLRDASDIITPLAALMSMCKGGVIVGASHARGKESDRIRSTIRMLSSFGIEVEEVEDGLIISGGQCPNRPENPIDCENDHRIAMTAAVLATKVGGELSGQEICEVTHPGFLEMILAHNQGR